MILDTIKLRKSAGVPVSAKVHAILRSANEAREVRDHARAADLYRAALDRDPSLAHVWVQFGHMLRLTDRHDEAAEAYNEALRLKPESSDPHLHLGHLYKETGQVGKAARSYTAAARADRTNADALSELHRLMGRGIEITPEDIMTLTDSEPDLALGEEDPVAAAAIRARSALDTLALALRQEGTSEDATLEQTRALLDRIETRAATGAAPDEQAESTPFIVFDVSDLISYFERARLPTGIQRVQIEVIRNAIRQPGQKLKICVFLDHRDEWSEISPALFLLLCRLSLSSGDLKAPEWISALSKLRLALTMAEPMEFPRGAFLVNLGTSWWLQNYFLYVRKAKAQYGIRYVPFVHDVIPVMASEHCTRELTQDFISWVLGAFDHADCFFVNSEATRRDLLRVAKILGHEIDAEKIVVIRLDADFRRPITAPLSASALARWGIGRSDFVLFVSTIESRKNHIGAFEAWINLLRQHGPRRIPKLVCVGNKGWLNDAVYARLATHDGLRDHVVMLSGLSDPELDLLYRHCLFTLYPSNYEGWGLPVTESLCHGKVPLLSDASSLPEAGGAFGHYFEAGSTPRLTAALQQLILEPAVRAEKEARIRSDFKARQWADIAAQMAAAIRLWGEADDAGPAFTVPAATLGQYHPITRNYETRIWPGMRSAEIFRAGAGWWGPDNFGCWTKAQGGQLEIAVPEGIDHGIRLYLQLHGLPGRDCIWSVTLDGGRSHKGTIASGAFKWACLDFDTLPDDRILRVTVESDTTVDLRTVTNNGDPRVVAVGVAGFFVCATDDNDTRAMFLEALALGNLEDMAFNRERAGADTPRQDR